MIGQARSLLRHRAFFGVTAAGLCKKARFVVKYGVPKGSNSLIWLRRNFFPPPDVQQVVITKFPLPACWACRTTACRARPSIETCTGLIEASRQPLRPS